MITPPPLKKGDTIGLVSTARKISREELKPAVSLLDSWGLKIRFAPYLFEEDRQFAGTDRQRRDDLQGFLHDPEIRAILCCRGGYGTIRIIDDLCFFPLVKDPKWICGYSDVTVLLNKLQKEGIESLHSTMPVNFSTSTRSALGSLKNALFGKAPAIECPSHPLNRDGQAKGRVTGGNLSVLYSQLGSGTALDTEGCILFIEDLDEYLYHIDRMMQGLKRAGYFEKLAGLVVGGMTAMRDNTISFGKSAGEIIADAVQEYPFPVCFDFPAGHIENNQALIMGREATLMVGDPVSLVFENG